MLQVSPRYARWVLIMLQGPHYPHYATGGYTHYATGGFSSYLQMSSEYINLLP